MSKEQRATSTDHSPSVSCSVRGYPSESASSIFRPGDKLTAKFVKEFPLMLHRSFTLRHLAGLSAFFTVSLDPDQTSLYSESTSSVDKATR